MNDPYMQIEIVAECDLNHLKSSISFFTQFLQYYVCILKRYSIVRMSCKICIQILKCFVVSFLRYIIINKQNNRAIIVRAAQQGELTVFQRLFILHFSIIILCFISEYFSNNFNIIQNLSLWIIQIS